MCLILVAVLFAIRNCNNSVHCLPCHQMFCLCCTMFSWILWPIWTRQTVLFTIEFLQKVFLTKWRKLKNLKQPWVRQILQKEVSGGSLILTCRHIPSNVLFPSRSSIPKYAFISWKINFDVWESVSLQCVTMPCKRANKRKLNICPVQFEKALP